MRKTDVVSVGKGCVPITAKTLLEGDRRSHRCEEHFWLYLNICLGCGERFHTYRPHTKTCSDKCRKRLSRLRHDTLFQMVMQFADGVA
jgi:predicted nucleic acid-binding Zn ribbon protein